MHLASIGLLIEIIAHELYRATTNALDTLSGARSSNELVSHRPRSASCRPN